MAGFADEIRDFTARVKDLGHEVVGLTIVGLAAEIDKMSPVGNPDLWLFNRGTKDAPDYTHFLSYRDANGYLGGHFRANWQLGVGSMPTGEVAGIDPTGEEAQGRILSAIPDEAAGLVYYIANNLPYAQRLESGWSSQAPSGMVGLAVTMFPQLVDVAVVKAKAKAP